MNRNLDANLRHYLASRGHPVGMDEIVQALRVPKRTLQRAVQRAVLGNTVQRIGSGRVTKYILVQETQDLVKVKQELRQYMLQPIEQRTPVTYQHEFLDAYQPNVTYYLSESIRKHLRQCCFEYAEDKPAGTFAKNILNRLLIDLSWNSSRLEGNTYSLLETQRLIMYGEQADSKSLLDAQMILNHKAAIEFLVKDIDAIGINAYTIQNIHALLADGLLDNPRAIGRIREIPVGIGKTVYTPLAIPLLIEDIFREIVSKCAAIKDPFEQSFFLMVHLPYLQPFEDVNKRTSRLAANLPLVKNNLCPISFTGLPTNDYLNAILCVYEMNRVELLVDVFVSCYEASARTYVTMRDAPVTVDRFKFQHHENITMLVKTIVIGEYVPAEAARYISKWADKSIVPTDRDRFIETVENQLMYLDISNIARYDIEPDTYSRWQKTWNS